MEEILELGGVVNLAAGGGGGEGRLGMAALTSGTISNCSSSPATISLFSSSSFSLSAARALLLVLFVPHSSSFCCNFFCNSSCFSKARRFRSAGDKNVENAALGRFLTCSSDEVVALSLSLSSVESFLSADAVDAAAAKEEEMTEVEGCDCEGGRIAILFDPSFPVPPPPLAVPPPPPPPSDPSSPPSRSLLFFADSASFAFCCALLFLSAGDKNVEKADFGRFLTCSSELVVASSPRLEFPPVASCVPFSLPPMPPPTAKAEGEGSFLALAYDMASNSLSEVMELVDSRPRKLRSCGD
mmetsp:Transcript_2157/g.4873  ORF Transcript_2157/g.4873 Transcript_2157/m.4873 type:complete len:299 (+) Transcript_2157:310-1206(+)